MLMTLTIRYEKNGKKRSKTWKDQTGMFRVREFIRKNKLEKQAWIVEVI
jgi:hypothetical protein